MVDLDEGQKSILFECIAVVLRPIVRLMLASGMNCVEFENIVRMVYVRVATETYGVRGRPTNVSRVAALTGLSRREIGRIRALPSDSSWSPDEAVNPLNTVIHYWRFDSQFNHREGAARPLILEGKGSFTELARKYVSGIPAIAILRELERQGVASQDDFGFVHLLKQHAYPNSLDADFYRNWAFSLGSLGGTLSHNANMLRASPVNEEVHLERGRFEQVAWSHRLSESGISAFQAWVRKHGHEFLQDADSWIARNESDVDSSSVSSKRKVSGVGVFFFVNANNEP